MPAARTSSRALARCLALALSTASLSCGSPRAGSQPPRPGDAAVRRAVAVTAADHAAVADLARGPDGTVAIAGSYAGALAVGGRSLAATGGDDGYVALLDSAGAARWAVAAAGPGPDRIDAVAVARDGRVAIAGAAAPGARLAGKPLPPVFIASLTAAGEPAWIAAVDTAEQAGIADLAFTADGELIAVGFGAGTISVGDARVTADGSLDALVMRLGPAGEVRWLRRAGGPRADHAHAVAVAGEHIAVAGSFAATAELWGVSLRTNHHQDGFLAVLAADGRLEWVNSFGGSGRDTALAVAADGDLVAVAGTFESSDANFGTGAIDAEGAAGFAAGFSATGEPRWSLRIGDRTSDATAIAIDGDRVWVGGTFEHAQTVKGFDIDARGKRDAVVVGLDRDGGVHQAITAGSDGYDDLAALAAGGGRVLAGGSFAGELRAGSERLEAAAPAGFVLELVR